MQGRSQTIFVVTFLRSLTTAISRCSAKWRLDEDSTSTPKQEPSKSDLSRFKELTFIVLVRASSGGELATSDIPTLPMIGDVNIFLNGNPGDEDFEAEAEVMIVGESTLRDIYAPLLPSPHRG